MERPGTRERSRGSELLDLARPPVAGEVERCRYGYDELPAAGLTALTASLSRLAERSGSH